MSILYQTAKELDQELEEFQNSSQELVLFSPPHYVPAFVLANYAKFRIEASKAMLGWAFIPFSILGTPDTPRLKSQTWFIRPPPSKIDVYDFWKNDLRRGNGIHSDQTRNALDIVVPEHFIHKSSLCKNPFAWAFLDAKFRQNFSPNTAMILMNGRKRVLALQHLFNQLPTNPYEEAGSDQMDQRPDSRRSRPVQAAGYSKELLSKSEVRLGEYGLSFCKQL
ncbi:hypothetical protein CPB83DRAFT_840719 [Crepidotus variabilis]|uniref:Uncharacterized protein n=1 Tax=Crepidotus variabilis TaxID=179855 RepID=A0A9P6JIG6_9AGAR|nr:hypothetical protein CPB83DRAFT_840719 [Crepidotus variabilis]